MRQFQGTFIGIGAQKCASTWLYATLRQCPDVRVSDEKEVDFFSYYFDRGYEWYERQLQSEPPRRHRGDISPSYFIHPAAAERARAYNPEMRIVLTLRDPVQRAFSNHLHEVRKGHVSGANLVFETALANNPLYVDQGRYATHLTRWLDAFGPQQVLVLFQEEIVTDRVGKAREVTDFLGLPPIPDYLDLHANESVRYRNAQLGAALWQIGDLARRRGLGRLVETVKAAPGIRQMRKANREALKDVIAPMAEATAQQLTETYAEEVARLERMIGRPVPWSRFRTGTPA